MSFILDALKKSESDRQRQSGPALFEVKVAPPRTGLPPWAIAVAALLVVNLAIVMWMLWRDPATRTPDTSPRAAPAGAPPPPHRRQSRCPPPWHSRPPRRRRRRCCQTPAPPTAPVTIPTTTRRRPT